MAGNGQAETPWGFAVEGQPAPMLQAALRSLARNGGQPAPLPACNGEACGWVRRVAECLQKGTCRAAVLFCRDPGLACCVANKVPGVRAVAVWTIPQAHRAIQQLGANLLVVEMAGRTYFECKELLRLCQTCDSVSCPAGVACVLQELDGHAHR
jgi:hypothetical protein